MPVTSRNLSKGWIDSFSVLNILEGYLPPFYLDHTIFRLVIKTVDQPGADFLHRCNMIRNQTQLWLNPHIANNAPVTFTRKYLLLLNVNLTSFSFHIMQNKTMVNSYSLCSFPNTYYRQLQICSHFRYIPIPTRVFPFIPFHVATLDFIDVIISLKENMFRLKFILPKFSHRTKVKSIK